MNRQSAGHASTTSSAGDPDTQFTLLQRVHDAVLGGEKSSAAPRPVISESWERSLAARVDPDGWRPPVIYARDEVPDVRSGHPLRQVVPLLRGMLVEIADAAEHVMIVTDADGTILWREGSAEVCRSADPVGLCEGAGWAERAIGTNAMGTALAVGEPVQIYSAEHLVRTYHRWTCAAAPIHDPDTGGLLGTVDVSGLLQDLHPAVVRLVSATAQLAESHLRMRMAVRDEELRTRNMPHLTALRDEPAALLAASGRVLASTAHGAWPERVEIPARAQRIALDDGTQAQVEPLTEGYLLRIPRPAAGVAPRSRLSLSCLRQETPTAVLNGHDLPLTLRHAELLTLLALHPAGLSAEQLALQLYGEAGNSTTVRAQMYRLRTLVGADVVQTRPYRLRAVLDADFLEVDRALRAGDPDAALAAGGSPLLAQSEAPTICDERERLVVELRSAVLRNPDVELMWQFGQSPLGRDDIEVFELLAQDLPPHDPRRQPARTRLRRLLSTCE